jgi:hypothetical protein
MHDQVHQTGTYRIQAIYSGDASFGSSSSAVITQVVRRPGGGMRPSILTSGAHWTEALGRGVLVHPGVRVVCPAHDRSCSTEAAASSQMPGSTGSAKTRRWVRVAQTHIAVGAGKTTAVTFRLNRTGVRLLRKFRKLRIAVLIVAHPNRGATVKRTKIITIRPPAKH